MQNELRSYAELIWDLAVNDFKTKYAGSLLGILWAFIQPLITVGVYYVVFQYGLRVHMESVSAPYVLWFIAGMIPWFFFSDCVGNGIQCLREYNYLVKKVLFPVRILPLIKLISAFFVHLVFLVFMVLLSMVYNTFFGISLPLILYYLLCLCLVNYTWILFSSAVLVFFKDFGQLIQIVLQVGMWATPILWDYHRIPPSFMWIMEMNPLYYIVEGYRGAFLGGGTVVPSLFCFVFFWVSQLLLLFAANLVFARLEDHFADVL